MTHPARRLPPVPGAPRAPRRLGVRPAGARARGTAAAELTWEALGPSRSERLAELLEPLAQAVLDGGAFPLPNPVGTMPVTSRPAADRT